MENAVTYHGLWHYSQALTPTSEILCPECEEWSPAVEWPIGESPCEDCGGHSAIVCPECGHAIDHVKQRPPTIEVRDPVSAIARR